MKELIKIDKNVFNDTEVNSVNARELHEYLGSNQKFADWIKNRIEKFKFTEGQDFIIISKSYESENNASIHNFTIMKEKEKHKNNQTIRPSIDYILTIDMAKELAMVENNDKGREVRRYFIEIEKKFRGQSLINLDDTDSIIDAFEKTIIAYKSEKQKKVDTETKLEKVLIPYNNFMSSEDAISIGDYAKIIGYGQNRLFSFLRDKKILKTDNVPYQSYVDNNYFKVIEEIFQVKNSDGVKNKISLKTLITPKGQEWFINKYGKEIRI